MGWWSRLLEVRWPMMKCCYRGSEEEDSNSISPQLRSKVTCGEGDDWPAAVCDEGG